MDDGVPMCILCYEPFDSDEVIPRVLTCGHSLCESCIPNLIVMNPPACPTCKAPIRVGNVHMFPKNFELLRLLAPAPKNARPKHDRSIPTPSPSPDFMFWSQELVYRWKKWIIPPQAVEDQSISMNSGKSLGKASIKVGVTTVCGTDVEPNRLVSLLPLPRAPSVSQGCGFRLSYMGRILDMLDRMEERGREELAAVLEAVSRQRRGICRMYGLWMNSLGEDSVVYLVCGSSHWDLSQSLEQDEKLHHGVVGMELCEAVMASHLQGIVCGFLSPSCFFFDCHGHFLLDLNHALHVGRELRYRIESGEHIKGYDPSSTCAFISPEMFLLLRGENNSSNSCSEIAHSSDVWSLACVFMLLMGNASLRTALFNLPSDTLLSVDSYNVWMEEIILKLQDSYVGEGFDSLKEIIKTSLSYEPRSRPQVADLWRCMRKLVFKHYTDHVRYTDVPAIMKSSIYCLLLLGHTSASKQTYSVPKYQKNQNESLQLQGSDALEKVAKNVDIKEIIQKDNSQVQGGKIDKIQNAGMQDNLIRSFTLEGHHDCVTGLAIGEGFLFSSSNDKTIRAWSLQDFSYSHTFVGHEHRITAIVVASKRKLCLTADFGGFICAWSINSPSDQVPLKKWLEHRDWHFGKVNSLAVDEYRIFSCSGDKSINVWSLKDFKHLQKMEGHSAAVNSLAVSNATLYSSSRDGTIRMWWLDDYTVMKVLGNEQWYGLAALSLSVDDDILVATYENGYIKIWRNHVAMKVMKIENGAIFASQMIKKKWLFTGGWDKTIEIQRVPTNECQVDVENFGCILCQFAITSLLYWQGKLFVGFSNNDIQVYSLEKF